MIRRLACDRRAVAAVEFALCLPFLVLLYIGGYQLNDAISAYRKVTTTTRTLADLTSQVTSVSDADLDTILAASTQIMAPYKAADAKLIVSQIKIDDKGNATIDWSRGLNVSKLNQGDSFTMPGNMKMNNSYLIVAQVTYTYTPIVGGNMIGVIPMHDQIFMGPRASTSVQHQT